MMTVHTSIYFQCWSKVHKIMSSKFCHYGIYCIVQFIDSICSWNNILLFNLFTTKPVLDAADYNIISPKNKIGSSCYILQRIFCSQNLLKTHDYKMCVMCI